jgi:hypothetical protein
LVEGSQRALEHAVDPFVDFVDLAADVALLVE